MNINRDKLVQAQVMVQDNVAEISAMLNQNAMERDKLEKLRERLENLSELLNGLEEDNH